MASRIQERNNTLCTELANLDVLRSQLTKAESDLIVNTAASTSARVKFLSTVQDRHTIELELLRTTVDDENKLKNEIDTLRTEIQQYQDQSQILENKFAQDYLPMYSKHSVSTSLYLMECESKLASAQKKRKHREERLRTLREKTNQQRNVVDEMREERTRISRGFAELDRREEEDDEETMALGMQIKDLLAKVSRVCKSVCVCAVLCCQSNPSTVSLLTTLSSHWTLHPPSKSHTLRQCFVTFFNSPRKQKASIRKELNTMREVQQSAKSNREKWQRRTTDGTVDY